VSLLNRKAVREFLLKLAEEERHQPFTRVSEGALTKIEAHLREHCRAFVRAQPSKGKTIS